MKSESISLYGEVTLDHIDSQGQLVRRVQARNTVVKGGRSLVAALFAGKATITKHYIAIGEGSNATVDTMTKLHKAKAEEEADLQVVPRKPDVLSLTATLKVTKKSTIRETGVCLQVSSKQTEGDIRETRARTSKVLYNHAVLPEPIQLGTRDQLLMSWQISFTKA